MVCVLDADKEGFLRNATSLIQTMGRAARNERARVILYADAMTPSMAIAIEETERRRAKQIAYNTEHGIVPKTIQKSIRRGIESELKARRQARESAETNEKPIDARVLAGELEAEMLEAAEAFQFEKAAKLRDQMLRVREIVEAEVALMDAEGIEDAENEPVMVKRSEVERAIGGKGGGGSKGAKKGRKRSKTGKPGS